MQLDGKKLQEIDNYIKEKLESYENLAVRSMYDSKYCCGCVESHIKPNEGGYIIHGCENQNCIDVSVGIPITTERAFKERLAVGGLQANLKIERELDKVIKEVENKFGVRARYSVIEIGELITGNVDKDESTLIELKNADPRNFEIMNYYLKSLY